MEEGYNLDVLTMPSDIETKSDGILRVFSSTFDGQRIPAPYFYKQKLSEKIKIYFGDRNDKEKIKLALDDFKPDLIADFVCFLPEQASSLIDLVYNRVEHYVFISTVDIYG